MIIGSIRTFGCNTVPPLQPGDTCVSAVRKRPLPSMRWNKALDKENISVKEIRHDQVGCLCLQMYACFDLWFDSSMLWRRIDGGSSN